MSGSSGVALRMNFPTFLNCRVAGVGVNWRFRLCT